MTTGIANVIIVVRGLDMMSKPFTHAANVARKNFVDLKKQIEQSTVSYNKAQTTVAKLESANSRIAERSAFRSEGLIHRRIKLLQQQEIITKKIAKVEGTKGKYRERRLATLGGQLEENKFKIGRIDTAIGFEAENAALRINTNKETIATAQATIAAEKASMATNKLSLAKAKLAMKITSAQEKLVNFSSKLSSFGLMVTAIGTSLGAMVGMGIGRIGVEFDKQMRNIQSISQASDKDNKRLGDSFRALSKDISKTVASPTELSDAFYEIQSAAFYGSEAEKILSVSTKAATAGLADQKETAKAVVMSLHAYDKGAESAAGMTDMMMRAVDIGIFKFEDLTTQMGEFIGAAGMMKLPFEETMAALTTMTKKGLPISEAATSLNRIILAYLKPSKKERELADLLGIDLSATSLKTKGLAGAMQELIDKTGGSEDTLTNLIGETRAIRGVFALAGDGLRTFNNDLEQIKNSSGTVDRVFTVQMQSWSAQLLNLKNHALDLGISFSEVLMPIVINFIKKSAIPFIEKIRAWDEGSKQTAITLTGLVASIGPLAIATSVLTRSFAGLIGILTKINPAILLAMQSFKIAGLGLAAIGGWVSAIAIVIGLLALAIKLKIDYNKAVAKAAWDAHIAELTIVNEKLSETVVELKTVKDAYLEYQNALAGGNAKKIENAAIDFYNQKEMSKENIKEVIDGQIEIYKKELERLGKTIQEYAWTDDIYAMPTNDTYALPVEQQRKILENARNEYIKIATEIARYKNEGDISGIFKITSDALSDVVGGRRELSSLRELLQLLKKDANFFTVSSNKNNKNDWGWFLPDNMKGPILDRLGPSIDETIIELGNRLSAIKIPSLDNEQNTADLFDTKNIDNYIKKIEESNLADDDKIAKLKELKFSFDQQRSTIINTALAMDTNTAGLEYLAKAVYGADGNVSEFIENWDKLTPELKDAVLQMDIVSVAIDDLRNAADKPITVDVLVNMAGDALSSIRSSLVDLGKDAGLTRVTSMYGEAAKEWDTLIANLKIREELGNLAPMEGEILIGQFEDKWDTAIKGIQDGFDKVTDSGNDSASDIESAFEKAAGNIKSKFEEGMGFSKGLGDLTGGTFGGGALAPGANGPFEKLYQIQDIAMNLGKVTEGKDTKRYAEMFGLDAEKAKQIIKDFQMGNFTPDVMQYVDTDKLIDVAKMELIAQKSQEALYNKLAEESGLDKDIFAGIFGMSKDKSGKTVVPELPAIDIAAVQGKINDQINAQPKNDKIITGLMGASKENVTTMFGEVFMLLFTEFDATFSKEKENLKNRGKSIWTAIEEGVTEQAGKSRVFYDAVETIVLNIIGDE